MSTSQITQTIVSDADVNARRLGHTAETNALITLHNL